ncbi:hypothetical protein KI387_033846, partial [Taxus chinensis]
WSPPPVGGSGRGPEGVEAAPVGSGSWFANARTSNSCEPEKNIRLSNTRLQTVGHDTVTDYADMVPGWPGEWLEEVVFRCPDKVVASLRGYLRVGGGRRE